MYSLIKCQKFVNQRNQLKINNIFNDNCEISLATQVNKNPQCLPSYIRHYLFFYMRST